MRRVLIVTALCALAPGTATGAARLADDSRVHALAAVPSGALAVVDSGNPAAPYALIRSSGRTVTRLGSFGGRKAEFPDVAASGGSASVTWGVPVSGGAIVRVAAAPGRTGEGFGPTSDPLFGTGPGRLAFGPDAAALLAYPDRSGDVTIAEVAPPGRSPAAPPQAVTSSAPELRHLPLDFATDFEDTRVLDLVQSRTRSELRVIGTGAPRAPLLSLRGVQHPQAQMAAADGVIAVAYHSSGRVTLALPRGGGWSHRRLPGAGGGVGAPAPVISGGKVYVVYTQTVRERGRRPQREVFLHGPGGLKRLTRTAGTESYPFAAAGPGGRVYAGWTHRGGRPSTESARLARIG